MDQNPLSSRGTLLKDNTGLSLRNKPSTVTITNHRPLNHRYPTKDAGKDSRTITKEGEPKPLTLNSKREILTQWIPQQAKL
jgi:hypothetical protein